MDRQLSRGVRVRTVAIAAAAVVAVGGAAVGLVPLASRWGRAEHSIDASRLRIGPVTAGDLVSDLHVEGRLVSAKHPTLFAAADGIVAIDVRPGELVEAGQRLATVRSPGLESRLKQETSTLHALQSDYERQRIANRQQNLTNRQHADLAQVKQAAAEREQQRAQQMFGKGIASEADLERAKDQAAIARLTRDHADQSLAQQTESLSFELRDRKLRVERQQHVVVDLERQLADLSVRSPVDGLVGELFASDRDAVAERQPLLKVVDLSQFEIALEIPEGYAADVVVGAPAEIRIGARHVPGTVSRVAPSVDNGSVAGTASFAGDQPDGLRQNQRAAVRILLDRRDGVVVAPRGAYVEAGGAFAYVVRDGVAHRTPIVLGARGVSEVEVVDGLSPGDQIVLSDLGQFDDAATILLY